MLTEISAPFAPPSPVLAIFDNFTGGDWVAVTLAAVILAALAFVVGRQWARLMGHRERKERTEKMFQIEKSLSDFYEHEKKKFLAETEHMKGELELKDKEIEELRRKAAGVTGRGKDARGDMMLQLLAENEALQEKLFEENVRQKEERDRQLSRELQQISYQRVLLSRLLSERGVQEAVVEIFGDEKRVAELRSSTPELGSPPAAADEKESAREGGGA